jgi:murein L,D-transpeptidase YcbB/YkuD
MKKLFYIFTTLLLISCKTQSDEITISKKLSVKETLQMILSEEYQGTLGIDEHGRKLLYTFYEKRNFKPLWATKKTTGDIGDTLVKLLKSPIRFGISDKRFDLKWDDNIPIQNEVVVVCGLARSYYDLKYGMLDSAQTALKANRYVSLESLDTLLDFSAKNYAQKIISWGPNDTTYHYLANALFQFVSNNRIDEPKIDLKTIKEDTLAAIEGTKQILVSKNYLDIEHMNDSLDFITALKKFQTDHGCNPDGIIGESTVRILTETNLHKAQRIALAMEKQRHAIVYPKRYFHINIPEYMLRLYNEDTLCSENRIVIGKYENQTPELQSALHTIVVYPYWNVPYSISSKEILPAAKRNPNYFDKNDMILLKKGDTINPYKVNWKKIKENTFPYKVVQQPGYKNSLGILKFDFHNKYDVYFHDTPSKGLFNTVARSYSHGCMRTENPVDLAKVVLELDENVMTADSLDTLITHTGINFSIRIKKRIPVYIEYKSVVVQNGITKILKDVYLRDEKFLKIMFNKPEDVNS